MKLVKSNEYAPVAQLDRVPGYELKSHFYSPINTGAQNHRCIITPTFVSQDYVRHSGMYKTRVDLYITSGWKYQVTKQRFEWRLLNNFTITKAWEHPDGWYGITANGIVYANIGCCYDGPTWFPDVWWMMIASLVHDILHWLINMGIIPVSENDLIDKELGDIVKLTSPPWWSPGGAWTKGRAWAVKTGTGFVNQKKTGVGKRIKGYTLFVA